MRTINIEDKKIKLHGSTLTLFLFEQEFNEDMLGKIAELAKVATSLENLGEALENGDFSALSNLKSMTILRIGWALNKSATSSKTFPNFEEWLRENEEISPFNPEFILGVVEETMKGCFRGTGVVTEVSKEQGETKEAE